MLGRKTYDTLTVIRKLPRELAKEIKDIEIVVVQFKMTNLKVWPIILEDIKKAQEENKYLAKA